LDIENPVIQLCLQGTQAEFDHRLEDAWALYQQAWDTARDAYEACVAAHYLARGQKAPADSLYWNAEALRRADAVGDERVKEFYPSLYLSLGQAHELAGHQAEAQHFYALSAALGFPHQTGE